MRALFIAAAFAFVTDQVSKLYVMFGLKMQVGEVLDIFPPFLIFLFGWNPGINFGLFSDHPDAMRWVLTALAVGISAFLIWWARRSLSRRVTFVSAGLIVGGALGNALDRILYGAVADFLNMSCCGYVNPFIFNVADIWIFAGAFGIILFSDDKAAHKTP